MDPEEPQVIHVAKPQSSSSLHVFLLFIPAIIFVAIIAMLTFQSSSNPQVLSTEVEDLK
jgi:hypothetical protein